MRLALASRRLQRRPTVTFHVVASDELKASWERTERHLRAALAHQQLPQDTTATAAEFIDHNELGVAFEYVVSVLVDRGIALNGEACKSLAAAAAEMRLEDNSDWIALTR